MLTYRLTFLSIPIHPHVNEHCPFRDDKDNNRQNEKWFERRTDLPNKCKTHSPRVNPEIDQEHISMGGGDFEASDLVSNYCHT